MGNPDIKRLTPDIATDYLNFKVKQKEDKEDSEISKKNTISPDPERFLGYRDELVPHYFSEQGFCDMINLLRKKIWENKNAESPGKLKSTAFIDAVREVVYQRTKEMPNDIKTIVNSLVGVLLHVFRDSNYQEYINKTGAKIFDNLQENSIISDPSPTIQDDNTGVEIFDNPQTNPIIENSSQTPQDDKPFNKKIEGVTVQPIRNTVFVDSEIEYQKEDQFSMILEGLKTTYFFDPGIGNETNSSENADFFDQAWRVFEKDELQDVPPEEKEKLHTYLYEKYTKQN